MSFPVASNFTDFTPVFPGIPGTAPKIYTASTPANLAAVTTADFAFNEINNGWLSAGDLVNIKYLDGLMDQTTQQFVMGSDGKTLQVFGDGSGTLTSLLFNNGLTASPNPVTTSGTAGLAAIATLNLLANLTGGTAVPVANTLSAILDACLSSTQGTTLYRGALSWSGLAPGLAGSPFVSQGAAANPAYSGMSIDTNLNGSKLYGQRFNDTVVAGATYTTLAADRGKWLLFGNAPTVAITLDGTNLSNGDFFIFNPASGVTASLTAAGGFSLVGNSTLYEEDVYLISYFGTEFKASPWNIINGADSLTPTANKLIGYDGSANIALLTAYLPVDNNGGGSVNANTINFANGTGTTASVSNLAGVSTVTINSTTSGTVSSVAMTGDNVIFNSSVTGSPITTSGTLIPSLKTQTANTLLCGPTSGSAATPTFRALTAADFPSGSSLVFRSPILDFTSATTTLIGTTDSTGRSFNVTAVRYVIATANTVTVPFQASVGITGAVYTDISANLPLTLLTAANTSTEAPLQPVQPVIPTVTGIFVKVNVGATASAITGYVDVQGYYE